MKQRTKEQIEKDIAKIRFASQTSCTMKEVSEKTGLSISEINTSLSSHPVIKRRIIEQLKLNRQDKRNTLTLKESNSTQSIPKSISKKDKYVIDTSICGSSEAMRFISSMCNKKDKFQEFSFILLSSVIIELHHLQKKPKGFSKQCAIKIMNIALRNPEIFETHLVDWNFGTTDDSILNYCSNNKDSVILLTSDKELALLANASNIKTNYYKIENFHKQSEQNVNHFDKSINYNTLNLARYIGGQLIITDMKFNKTTVTIRQNDKMYTEGPVNLMVGDDVYIVSKKDTYISFIHYKITSLSYCNNCTAEFHRRILTKKDIDTLPNHLYKSLIREFKHDHKI